GRRASSRKTASGFFRISRSARSPADIVPATPTPPNAKLPAVWRPSIRSARRGQSAVRKRTAARPRIQCFIQAMTQRAAKCRGVSQEASLRGRLFLRGDLGAADEAGGLIYHQTRRFDVAVHAATGAQFAALAGRDVAVHGAIHNDRPRRDIAFDSRLFADREPAIGIDLPIHFAIDQQLFLKFNRAFDGNSARESSARTSSFLGAVRRWGLGCFGRCRRRRRRHWSGGFYFSVAGKHLHWAWISFEIIMGQLFTKVNRFC